MDRVATVDQILGLVTVLLALAVTIALLGVTGFHDVLDGRLRAVPACALEPASAERRSDPLFRQPRLVAFDQETISRWPTAVVAVESRG